MSPSPQWQEALCADLDPSEADKIFFIGKGGSLKPARELCGKCPVRIDCLNHAIKYKEIGVWAGTNDKERSRLVKLGLVTVRPHEIGLGYEEPLLPQEEQ
jgi:WhiB family redox-sensing transcriptional regulator